MTESPQEQSRLSKGFLGWAYWQWVVGLTLIGGAIWNYTQTSKPRLVIDYLTLPARAVEISDSLTPIQSLPAKPGSLAGYNLLIVTLDTARPDRIGCYGNKDIQTPTLDGLASKGVLFSRATAVAPTTLPTHSSIMSGLYPYHHGARANALFPLGKKVNTLAEVLAGEGYRTAAKVSSFVLDSRFGLNQGFASYDDKVDDHAPTDLLRHPERKADATTDRATSWLKHYGDEKFFLWVHYFDPHARYKPPSPFAEQYEDNPYDGEIAFTDRQLGRLLDALEQTGQAERTLVIVVADHGESLGSHNEAAHGFLVYNSSIHVPMIMYCPSNLKGGLNFTSRVSQVDIMPTVLSLLGAPAPSGMDGLDLTQPVPTDRVIYVENLHGLMQYGWAPLVAVFQNEMKYIHGPKPVLVDLAKDPEESANLYGAQNERASALHAHIADLFGDDLESALTPQPENALDPQELAKLKSLGYTFSGAKTLAQSATRGDPQEMLLILQEVERTMDGAMITSDVRPTLKGLEEIARRNPEFAPTFRYLGALYSMSGQLAKSQQAYRHYLKLCPSPHVGDSLAEGLAASGEIDEAIKVLEDVLSQDPLFFDSRKRLGSLLLNDGRVSAAAGHLRAAFDMDPSNVECARLLGVAMQASGQQSVVEELFARLLAEDSTLWSVRMGLASLLVTEQRFSEVRTILAKGVEIDPESVEAAGTFTRFLTSCPDKRFRDPALAVRVASKLCERLGYEDPEALYHLSMAYGSAEQYDEALDVAERAKRLAETAGRNDVVARLITLIAEQTRAKELGVVDIPGAAP